MKWNKFLKSLDKLFVLILLCLLIIPLFKFNLDDRSVEENRMLQKWPQWENFSLWNGDNYFKALENWFNDRFNHRAWMMAKAYDLDARINNTHENNHAFMGQDNWIFTKERNSIGNFQNTTSLNDEEKEHLTATFTSINDWCRERHIKLYVFVAPDKNQIYGEAYPDKIRKVGTENQIDQIVSCLKDSGVSVLYPKQYLLDHKDKGLLYYKNDTHWDFLGAYYGYEALVHAIGQDFPVVAPIPGNRISLTESKNPDKDLMKMLNLDIPEYDELTYLRPVIADPTSVVKETEPGSDKAKVIVNAGKPQSVLFISDSFTAAMRPYLNETFGKVVYSGKDHLFAPEIPLIEQEKPDIIVIEVVGRYANDLLLNQPLKGGE